jgi:hypothetical protein
VMIEPFGNIGLVFLVSTQSITFRWEFATIGVIIIVNYVRKSSIPLSGDSEPRRWAVPMADSESLADSHVSVSVTRNPARLDFWE